MNWFLTHQERKSLRRITRMLDIDKKGFAFALFLGSAGLGAAIGLAATSAWLIARASQMPPVLYLSVAAVAVRMFGIMRALFRYLQRLASHKVALEGMDSLRLNTYDALSYGPIEQIAKLQRGDLLGRIGADIDTVGDLVVKAILPASVTLIVGAGTVIGFAFLSVPAALVLLFCLVLSGLVVPLLTMRSTRLGQIAEEYSKRQLSVTTMTIIEGADELQVDGRYPPMRRQLNQVSDQLNQARKKAAKPAALAAALDRVSMGIAVIGVFLVATPQVNAGLVAAVAFAVLILTPLAAFEGTAELAPAAAQLVRSAQAAVRIDELLGPNLASEHLGEDQKTLPNSVVVENYADRQGHTIPELAEPILSANNLAIGWPEGPVVASNFSFALQPGSRVAVVGPSGIGKTTLLYTLSGMLRAKSGELTLNGAAVWDADRAQTTQLVSLTTEDAHIFATSVYENLRVSNPHLSEDEATVALERMGLGDWLAGLPHGLDTQIGAGGTSISGGERRRLLLARALASPAPLMLLDEPGEHLDAETADKILRELLQGTSANRGILLVTHRLSELSLADRVLLVDVDNATGGATVVAQGRHEELMKTSESYRWSVEQEK